MKTVTLKDKTFRLSLPEAEILQAVDRVAEQMRADLAGKDPLFLVVLSSSHPIQAQAVRARCSKCWA